MICIPTTISRGRARTLALLAVVVCLLSHAEEARAQWGYGGFFGYNPENGGQTAQAINQRSLLAGQAAFADRRNIQPAANGPNSYMHRVRDTDFVGRLDISTRRGVDSQVARGPSPTRPNPAAAAAATPPAAPVALTIASFFNQARQIVWPADSPVNSGMDILRADSDKASLVVLDEFNAKGVASVASVTEARNLLLAYGRPALEHLRRASTTGTVDSFHRFLLGLYDALGQAAQPSPSRPR